MSKNSQQGAAWERELRDRGRDLGYTSDRMRQRGVKGEPDVYWQKGNPSPTGGVPVVAWKRLTGSGQRRTPDGARAVVVLDWEDWQDLMLALPEDVRFYVQAKAAERVNVTRVLGDLRKAIEEDEHL